MNIKERPKLSFCIPTYNRADMVVECVKRILQYTGDDIEVVVSDNCSEDDTLEKLGQIKDKRLKIYKNERNLGFEINVIKSIQYAKGEFCFYVNDREIVYYTKIKNLISEIESCNCDLFLTSVLWIGKTNDNNILNRMKNILRFIKHRKRVWRYYIYHNRSCYNDLETVKRIFDRGHPTGLVIRRDLIKFEEVIDRGKEHYIMYPHVYLMQLANSMGKTNFTKKAYSATMKNPQMSHTVVESEARHGFHYAHPASRYKQLLNRIEWLNEIRLTDEEKMEMLVFLYNRYLDMSENGYTYYMEKSEKTLEWREYLEKVKVYKEKINELDNTEGNEKNFQDEIVALGLEFLNEVLAMDNDWSVIENGGKYYE